MIISYQSGAAVNQSYTHSSAIAGAEIDATMYFDRWGRKETLIVVAYVASLIGIMINGTTGISELVCRSYYRNTSPLIYF